MLERLESAEARYQQIEAELADPAVCADGTRYPALMKEYKTLTPLVTAYRAWCRAKKEAEEARALIESGDPALAALASEEYRALRAKLPQLETELRIKALLRDENDDRNVIVEIRAGAGGEEAALFAAVLRRMYGMYADREGYTISPLGANETELGGYREVSFLLAGEGVFSRFKFESGVHRVQRVPVTESQGRIQTSTVSVAILPEVDEVEIEINPDDIVMESCKSSGAGGQHINKTESAVRITHKPSGIVVECQEERSQYKNRDKAMKMLRAKLYDIASREREAEIADARRGQVGTGDRSERIRTYNYPQNRVTDHRIGLSLYHLDKILDGDLAELFDALHTAEIAKRLAEAET